MSQTRLIITLFFAACLLSGCLGTDSTSNSTPPSPTDAAFYIENKGSDTIVNLALAWAEAYQKEHSNIRISVTGGGSGTGIASLVNGTVSIANASRAIKKEELAEAEKNNIKPFETVIARDAIAVIINPENPVNELSRGLKNHKNMNARTMERNINIVVSNWNCIINWALEAP